MFVPAAVPAERVAAAAGAALPADADFYCPADAPKHGGSHAALPRRRADGDGGDAAAERLLEEGCAFAADDGTDAAVAAAVRGAGGADAV